uniref:Uncharacterized protein n=1 Tax=Oryza meridionalis TaxID=40149 RepID=A0A0E0EIB1_9ORYZ
MYIPLQRLYIDKVTFTKRVDSETLDLLPCAGPPAITPTVLEVDACSTDDDCWGVTAAVGAASLASGGGKGA